MAFLLLLFFFFLPSSQRVKFAAVLVSLFHRSKNVTVAAMTQEEKNI